MMEKNLKILYNNTVHSALVISSSQQEGTDFCSLNVDCNNKKEYIWKMREN